jgi:hypothetical protein
MLAWGFGDSSVQAQDTAADPCLPQTSNTAPLWLNGIGHSAWSIALAKDDCRRLLSLWDSIGEDLKTETNGLAGTYVKGGYDWGYFLRWSTKKGFVVIPYYDQSLITDYGYGKVNFVDNSDVVFTPERQLKGGRGLGKMARKWTAIWDYFLPVEELEEFGNFHAGLGEYNEFNGRCCEFAPVFLARRIDGDGKTTSYPVPNQYKHFIKSPIAGEVVFVGKKKTVEHWEYQGKLYEESMDKTVLIPIKINLGKRQGVRRNMLFRLIGEPDEQYLQVVNVQQSSARGYVVRPIPDGKETYRDNDGHEQALPPIRVGTKITTSPRRD